MRVLFIGSGELACPALRKLSNSVADEIVAVVSQPDRPKGRRRRLAPCPLKQVAEELGLPVIAPESINAEEVLGEIARLAPDLIVVAAYGQFLGKRLLSIPKSGAINIHPSLLPRYRGAAPIQWALINGDRYTGVTILFVAEEMDAGDIILQERSEILPDDTSATLSPRLAEQGAEMLLAAMGMFRDGAVNAIPQDEQRVVLAPKLSKADGRIDFGMPSDDIANRVRGMYPWPCCFCVDPDGERLRILMARAEAGEGAAGELIAISEEGPLVAAGEGAVRFLRVQPSGKRPMSGGDYCNGHRVRVGARMCSSD